MTREFVLLNQLRHAEMDISLALEETTAKLQLMSEALTLEKDKTDMLLYQMLPEKVARVLKEGKTVEAEKFDEVTILFSDIVSFTKIAAAVSPMEIVDMLNSLYSKFDKLSTLNNVYKVETIGDAYMVVSGAPEICVNHAENMANMALSMVQCTRDVLSPVCGKPIQIRIGIHTGSVVAGVVGEKMPRYCLFGDTVNVAARMEHHGLPGRIHISETTYRKLESTEFQMSTRGRTNIKGKGKMPTYFLTMNNKQAATCGIMFSESEDSMSTDADLIFADGKSDEGRDSNSIISKSTTCLIL